MPNVLIPSKKDGNSFFQEITLHTKTHFFYGDLNTPTKEFDCVLIHWIEQLFNWKEPTEIELKELEATIKEWKLKGIKMVHAFHNEKKHVGMTAHFEKLYEIILNSCDIIVHFGDYSLNKYKNIFLNAEHIKINHPLYINSFKVSDKLKARNELAISKETIVFLIPGTVRTLEERKLILKNFLAIKNKNKILIAPRMFYNKMTHLQKGYYFLKKIPFLLNGIDRIRNIELNNKKFIIDDKFISNQELSNLMSASDIIWAPRLNSLNSGIVYLAYTFKKIVVGPNIGNIGEALSDMKMETYNPNSFIDIQRALKKSIAMDTKAKYYNINTLEKYNPIYIANQWDNLFIND
jgi:hypothetical protein